MVNYQPRHALSRLSWRARIIAVICAVLAVAGGGIAAAVGASAASGTPLSVTLSSSTDGASATWASSTSIALKVGSTSSTTFAQMKVNSPPTAAPSAPPSFTTDNYNSGSPRWVIEFSNHAYLFGYPTQLPGTTAADFTGNQWSVNNPPLGAPSCAQYDTYVHVLKCVDAAHSDVTSAYIVADGDQLPGTVSTLTNIQYNGQGVQEPVPAPAPTVGPVSSFADYSASCLDNSNFTWKDGNPLQLWRCGVAGGVDQNFKFATVGGHQVLEAVAPAGKPQGPWCVTTDTISRDRLQIESCTGATGQEVVKSGPYYMFTGTGLVMDDAAWNTHNGAKVIGYPKNNGRNQRWSLP